MSSRTPVLETNQRQRVDHLDRASSAGQGPVTAGDGYFRFGDSGGGTIPPLTVRYYRPPGLLSTSPILFVLHGIRRDASAYRDAWRAPARQFGCLVLCPEFPLAWFPSARYQRGNVVDANGKPLPPAAWTFLVIERLFDYVKAATGSTATRYFLYGHSAGGQFVHRLVLFLPDGRFEAAVAGNTGWYTMPVLDGDPFPYSLAGLQVDPRTLERALSRRLITLLGERDTNATDPNLRQTARAMRQGRTRFERGLSFFATASAEASRRNVALSWDLITVADASHSNGRMVGAAAHALFGSR